MLFCMKETKGLTEEQVARLYVPKDLDYDEAEKEDDFNEKPDFSIKA